MWRSSSVPITQKDLSSSRTGGSSNERSHGSGGAGVSPKIGRISIARRSHFCVSLLSGLCCENYAIPHDLSGQTLTLQLQFSPELRSLCFGLVRASPERPCHDASGLDAALRELEGDTTDFLDRPAHQERRLIDLRGNVFLGATAAALAR